MSVLCHTSNSIPVFALSTVICGLLCLFPVNKDDYALEFCLLISNLKSCSICYLVIEFWSPKHFVLFLAVSRVVGMLNYFWGEGRKINWPPYVQGSYLYLTFPQRGNLPWTPASQCRRKRSSMENKGWFDHKFPNGQGMVGSYASGI